MTKSQYGRGRFTSRSLSDIVLSPNKGCLNPGKKDEGRPVVDVVVLIRRGTRRGGWLMMWMRGGGAIL